METVKLRIAVCEHGTAFLTSPEPQTLLKAFPSRHPSQLLSQQQAQVCATSSPQSCSGSAEENNAERLVKVSLTTSENLLLQRLTKGGFEIGTAEYELSAFSSLAGYNWFGFKCFSELMS